LGCLQASNRSMSDLCRKFEPVPQLLKNIPVADKKALENAKVKKAIAAAGEELGASGRLVIRPSGTEPLIRLMAEGDNLRLVEKALDMIADSLTHSKNP